MPSCAHVMLALQCLNWLPIKQRIDYQPAILEWKSHHLGLLSYLRDLIGIPSKSHKHVIILDIKATLAFLLPRAKFGKKYFFCGLF